MWQDFLTKFNGKQGVGNTPENLGQCTGLCNVFIVDYLKKSFIWGDAKDWMYNYNYSDFDFIPNTPDYIPQQEDIIVKSGGTHGHVCIATGTGDTHKYEVFEQNVPLGGGCRLHTYEDEYKNVLGGLRIKQDTQSIILQQSDAFIAVCVKLGTPANREVVLAELDKLIQMQDAVIQKDKQLADAQTQISSLEKDNQDKATQLQDLQTQVKNLADEVAIAVAENKSDKEQIAQLKQDCQPAVVYIGWRKMLVDFISKL